MNAKVELLIKIIDAFDLDLDEICDILGLVDALFWKKAEEGKKELAQ